MLDLQQDISKAFTATDKRRADIAGQGVKAYFQALGAGGSQSSGDFKAACDAAQATLKRALLSGELLAALSGGQAYDDQMLAGLRLSFDTTVRPLRVPPAPVKRDTNVYALAVGGLIGAAVGMLVLVPLLRWAYEMQELGFVLGGPGGALLGVLILHRLARIRALLRLLPGRSGPARRISGGARRDHEVVVRAAIESWLDGALPLLVAMCFYGRWSQESEGGREKAFRRIGELLYTLHQSSREALPVVADELIQAAKNCGFEGLDGPAVFAGQSSGAQETVVWSRALQSQYETFGHVVEGDRVTVERAPVVFEGEIVERGLVRKVRGKA